MRPTQSCGIGISYRGVKSPAVVDSNHFSIVGCRPCDLLIGRYENCVIERFESDIMSTKAIIDNTICCVSEFNRRLPFCQDTIHQTIPKIGGIRTVVNLHENAKPPTADVIQNHRWRSVSRKRQNSQNIAVAQATNGSSIVTIAL